MNKDFNFEHAKDAFIEIVKSSGIPFGKPYTSSLRVSFKAVKAKQPNRIVLLKEGNKISIVFHLARKEEIQDSYIRPRNGFIAKYITDVESERSTILKYLQKHKSRLMAELS